MYVYVYPCMNAYFSVSTETFFTAPGTLTPLISRGVVIVIVGVTQLAMAPLPLKLKPITAYIRRAEEFDRVRDGGQTKVIAYYCREYGECIE